MNSSRSHRAREILQVVNGKYPAAWQEIDLARSARGTVNQPQTWPQWCYAPLSCACAVIGDAIGVGEYGIPLELESHIGIVGALAAWRMGQQIIRYDETLYQSLIKTPVTGNLPTEIFYRLPAWCLYIETPGLTWKSNNNPRPIYGFFVHLEYYTKHLITSEHFHELRILIDTARTPKDTFDKEYGCFPVPLIMGNGTIADAFDRTLELGRKTKNARGVDASFDDTFADEVLENISPLISLALYLCSENPDWGTDVPRNPPSVKTKHGRRIFPVTQPQINNVGVRLGAALRNALNSYSKSPQGGTHASPIPHLRSAHYHTYWTGSKNEKQNPMVKWLSPILVNIDEQVGLAATIRPVKAQKDKTGLTV